MKRPRGQPVCSWMKGFGGVDTFPHSCKRPAVFFDRDGIVNLSPGAGYVERWEDFHIQPEFVDVLRLVTSMGFVAVVVSNQRGVARGRMSAATVDDMHRRLCEQLQAVGLTLLDVLYCPHEHDTCDCRKPQPGMLLRASAQHGLDLDRSWMVGDAESDVEAGRRAGCRTIRVGGDGPTRATHRAHDMANLAVQMAEWLTAPAPALQHLSKETA